MKIQTFHLLRLESKPRGDVITYVKSDFEENSLKRLGNNPRTLSRSEEYSVFSLTCNGQKLTFMGTGSGSPSLLSALFEVSSPNLSRLVRIGACGGLNKTKVGEILVCNSTLCGDRISRSLAGGDKALPDNDLSTAINNSLHANNIQARSTSNSSVDGMYLFEAAVDQAEKEGADCWDLETATVLAFGRKFGIRTASVLEVVSDRSGDCLEAYPPLHRLDYLNAILDNLTHH